MKHQTSWLRQLLNSLTVVTLTLSFVCGCGPSTPVQLPVFPTEGRVVFKSEPVAGATVAFYMEGAAVPGSGVTNAQGEFRISTYAENDGAIAGKHQVTISLPASGVPESEEPAAEPPKAIIDLESPDYRAGMQKVIDSASAKKTPTAKIPAKYASIKSTDLEVEVRNQPKNTFELQLRD